MTIGSAVVSGAGNMMVSLGQGVISTLSRPVGFVVDKTLFLAVGALTAPKINTIASGLIIYFAAKGGVALAKRAYNLKAREPSVFAEGGRWESSQGILAKKIMLYTGALFLFALSAYEITSLVIHFEKALDCRDSRNVFYNLKHDNSHNWQKYDRLRNMVKEYEAAKCHEVLGSISVYESS